MAAYEYKVIEWTGYDEDNPKAVIEAETDNRWEYWDSISHHGNRVDLVFRRPSGS